MHDLKVSLDFASATVLWFTGFAVVVANLFLHIDGLGNLGVTFCCGGAVLLIRSMMCRATKHLENLYKVGKDVGRMEAVPRQPTRINH